MLVPTRTWVVGLLVVASGCRKDAAPEPRVAPPAPDATGLIWIAEAGVGEGTQVAVDEAGVVYYGGRLADEQRVAGTGRPSSTRDDALYVAARAVGAGAEWARASSSKISQPYLVALAAVGGGRAALVIDANHQALDWGRGMVGAAPTADDVPAHLEGFRSASDKIPTMGLGVYVIGQDADDVTLLRAGDGDAAQVASDGAGVIVVGGNGWPADLGPAWKRADATACEAAAPMIVRWRDLAPDWVACLPIDRGQPTISQLALAADGDVIACLHVWEEDDAGARSWDARLVRLDADTGKTAWSVSLPERDASTDCDHLVTTADGHVVLGQAGVDTLTVFSGDAAPALDAPGSIEGGTAVGRGLAPGTIVVATSSELREIDVASGDVRWTYPLPEPVGVDRIAAGAGLIAVGGSYDEAFDGGAAGRLRAVDEDDLLAGFVLVVRP